MHKDDKYLDAEKLIGEVLKTEPKFSLPENFADFMAEKIGKKMIWKQFLKEFLIYLSAIFGAALIWGGISFLYYGADLKEWVNFFTSNVTLVVGVVFLIVFVLFSDRVLLPYFLFKKSPKTNLSNL